MSSPSVKWDPLHKAALSELLEQLGQTAVGHELTGETLRADVLFLPTGEPDAERVAELGLLGCMAAQGPCLFEPHSTNPRDKHLASAVEKVRRLDKQLARQRRHARRGREPVDNRRARVWVLSPGCPAAVMRRHGCVAAPGWPRGVYSSAEGYGLWIVAINQLPRRRETLLLRLLGRGRILNQALDDLAALPAGAPAHRIAAVLAAHLRSAPDPETAVRARDYLEQRDAEQQQKGQHEMLSQLFALRLDRPLTDIERTTLARLVKAGDEQVLRVVVDPDSDDLAAWLAERADR